MKAELAALILAGGYSRRMGRDKAWVKWQGQALWQHVHQRLQGQHPTALRSVWINTREPSDAFVAAVADGLLEGRVQDAPDYAGMGPLAGMHAGLSQLDSQWLLVVPCDTPLLPLDLLQRLQAAQAPVAIAASRSGDHLRPHPTVALLHQSALPGITSQLQAQDLKLMHWLAKQTHAVVAWADDQAFANVNDPTALSTLPGS